MHAIKKQIDEKEYQYTFYTRKKKNGKTRIITAPDEALKSIQRTILVSFYNRTESKYPEYLTGFIPNRSIVDNARKHINKDWVINIDIKDFFPSVKAHHVKWAMEQVGIKEDFPQYTIDQLVDFATLDGALPQGSPCSPMIANYVALHWIDPIIFEIVNNHGLEIRDYELTRYADDVTISIKDPSKTLNRQFLLSVCNEIAEELKNRTKFEIAPHKIQIRTASQRQEVTGITVNKQFSISRNERLKLRAELHHVKIGKKLLDDNLRGRLSFIRQINEELFNKLTKGMNT
jgi:hypothetical protein